jgi:hypothetical protein
VHLVNNDTAEAVKEVGPAVVAGKDPHVQHVRVGQHNVGVAPYTGSFLRWSVTVVYGGVDLGDSEATD